MNEARHLACGLAACIACVVTSSFAQTTVGTPASKATAEAAANESLFRHAEKYAASKGYSFGDGAHVMLNQVAQRGEAEIALLPPEKRQEKVEEARANFERFIDAMIVASKEIPGYEAASPGKIGEQTYARAKNKLCPIWPIC